MSTKSLRFPVILYKRAKEIMQQCCCQQNYRIRRSKYKRFKKHSFLILSTEVFWWFHSIFSIPIVTIFHTFLNDSRLHVTRGGHVRGQEKKHFSPLGTKFYFHVNSSRKSAIVFTPNMAALSLGCKMSVTSKFFFSANPSISGCSSSCIP